MTDKRKRAETKILKIVKTLDPTNTNYKRYKAMFDKMSDKQFDTLMKDIRDGKAQLYMLFPNMEIALDMKNILKAAEEIKLKVTERITRKDPITGRTYTTPYEFLILKLPVRRARQFLKGKTAIAESDTRVDSLTGQVVKPDRASALSYIEMQLLYSKGLNSSIQELIRARGGDAVAYAQLKQQLEETGEAYLSALDQSSVTQSSVTAAVLLTSMMFEHNLLEGRNL